MVSNRCMVAANPPNKKLQFESESFLKKVASDVCGQGFGRRRGTRKFKVCNCRKFELYPLMVHFYLLLRMSIEILSL